jgi:hypothetical protein
MDEHLKTAWKWYTLALVLILFGMCLTTRDIEYIHAHPGKMMMETSIFVVIAVAVVGGVCFLHGHKEWSFHILYTIGIVVLLHFMLQISGIYSALSYAQPTKVSLTLHDHMVEGTALAAVGFGVFPLLLYIVFLTYKHHQKLNFKDMVVVSEEWKWAAFLFEVCVVAVAGSFTPAIAVHDRSGKVPSHAAYSLSGLMVFAGGIYTLLYLGGAFS